MCQCHHAGVDMHVTIQMPKRETVVYAARFVEVASSLRHARECPSLKTRAILASQVIAWLFGRATIREALESSKKELKSGAAPPRPRPKMEECPMVRSVKIALALRVTIAMPAWAGGAPGVTDVGVIVGTRTRSGGPELEG